MPSNNYLVVLSGGQDSTTCLYIAKEECERRDGTLAAVSFDYGQKHARELEAAQIVAKMANAYHVIIKLPPELFGGQSPLTNHSTRLETYSSFEEMERVIGSRIERTFVPGRNLVFLSAAAAFAAGNGYTHLWTGICAADNANYPDCRSTFFLAMQRAIDAAIEGQAFINLRAPLLYLTKATSVEVASRTEGAMEALAYSHTCYAGEYPPCGKCHACVLRAEGFKQAGIPDPLIVRAMAER